jgi:hypothetical protein
MNNFFIPNGWESIWGEIRKGRAQQSDKDVDFILTSRERGLLVTQRAWLGVSVIKKEEEIRRREG